MLLPGPPLGEDDEDEQATTIEQAMSGRIGRTVMEPPSTVEVAYP